MSTPDKLLVEATIPSLDNPEVYVLNKSGNPPTETGPISHSTEQVLTQIGQKALVNGYLSIDRVVSRQDSSVEPVNIARVQAKPLDRSRIALSEDYFWSDQL